MDIADKQIDYKEIVAHARVGIAQLDTDGRHVFANDRYCELLGRTRAEVLGGELHDFIYHMDLDDSPSAKNQFAASIRSGIRNGTFEYVTGETFVRRDGAGIPVECWLRPIVVNGEVRGAICTIVPLAEREKIEDRQNFHIRELSHRVKNTFAIAQAVVGQTLRGISVPRDVIRVINQRLAALSSVNAVLMRTHSGNSLVMNVVEAVVAAHRSDARRLQICGPDIELGSRAALAITLALHELCTNAVKYGALSGDVGVVSIEWGVGNDTSEKLFRMRWKEQGGPPVTPPMQKGFGSRLIVDNVSADLRGRSELIFDSPGVQWTLEAPLAALME